MLLCSGGRADVYPGVAARHTAAGLHPRARCAGLPQGAVSGISEISRRAQSPEIWASSDLAVSSLLRDGGELIQPGVHQQQHALHLVRVRVGLGLGLGLGEGRG